jgi:hypothetical protein
MEIMVGRLLLTGIAAERFVVNLPAVALACSRWSGRRMDDECHYISTHIAHIALVVSF